MLNETFSELKCSLCKLSCVAKEETMNFRDFTLDKNVSSFLHEVLPVYARF